MKIFFVAWPILINNNVRYCIQLTVFLFFHYNAIAQRNDSIATKRFTERRSKAIYIEALGSSGLAFSLNYDMRFRPTHKGWGFRAGIVQPIRDGRNVTYSFPLMLNYINANTRVALEGGVGFILAYRRGSYEDTNGIIHYYQGLEYPAVANVGIRFQPLRTGVVWRLYWAPIWRIDTSTQTELRWFGTSLGIGF